MAITLPVVVGAAGLGVEAGKWYMMKRQAQTAADTGAFAGALELAAGTTSKAKPAARQEAARNGFPEGGDVTVTVNIPPTSGSHVGNTKAVEVIVTRTEPLLLAKLFLSDTHSDRGAGRRACHGYRQCLHSRYQFVGRQGAVDRGQREHHDGRLLTGIEFDQQ